MFWLKYHCNQILFIQSISGVARIDVYMGGSGALDNLVYNLVGAGTNSKPLMQGPLLAWSAVSSISTGRLSLDPSGPCG